MFEAVWCGARKGGRVINPLGSTRAAEWMLVTSTDCSYDNGGKIEAKLWASMVLPVPGGP